MRVQEIAKGLKKAGLNKKSWNTKSNCVTGDYEIREFNYNGIHSYITLNYGVFNEEQKGKSIEDVIMILKTMGLKTENKNGIIAILN